MSEVSRRVKINTAIVGLKNRQNAEQSGEFCLFFSADLKDSSVYYSLTTYYGYITTKITFFLDENKFGLQISDSKFCTPQYKNVLSIPVSGIWNLKPACQQAGLKFRQSHIPM